MASEAADSAKHAAHNAAEATRHGAEATRAAAGNAADWGKEKAGVSAASLGMARVGQSEVDTLWEWAHDRGR